jgi:hypothetical protein
MTAPLTTDITHIMNSGIITFFAFMQPIFESGLVNHNPIITKPIISVSSQNCMGANVNSIKQRKSANIRKSFRKGWNHYYKDKDCMQNQSNICQTTVGNKVLLYTYAFNKRDSQN